MRGPEGQEFSGNGCFLEIVEGEKLVWTAAMGPGYRPHPAGSSPFPFTAVITLESDGDQTRYCAIVIHPDEEACKKHAEMGFYGGWGSALTQLEELMKAQ
jgi:hypothetical protein